MDFHWQDLLAVPFLAGGDDPAAGLDCWGQARIVNARIGLALPDLSRARPTREDTELGMRALVRIAHADRIGDMLFADPLGLGYPSHVSTVVVPGRTALSTSERHGPYAWPLHRVPCALGHWRVAHG